MAGRAHVVEHEARPLTAATAVIGCLPGLHAHGVQDIDHNCCWWSLPDTSGCVNETPQLEPHMRTDITCKYHTILSWFWSLSA